MRKISEQARLWDNLQNNELGLFKMPMSQKERKKLKALELSKLKNWKAPNNKHTKGNIWFLTLTQKKRKCYKKKSWEQLEECEWNLNLEWEISNKSWKMSTTGEPGWRVYKKFTVLYFYFSIGLKYLKLKLRGLKFMLSSQSRILLPQQNKQKDSL